MDESVPRKGRLAPRALPLTTGVRTARTAYTACRACLRLRGAAGEQAGRALTDAFYVTLYEAALHAWLG